MSQKVVIIGSGVTGALSAFGIANLNSSKNILVLDKARGNSLTYRNVGNIGRPNPKCVGGRMTTSRTDEGNRADLGAQYVTTSQNVLEKYSNEYQLLFKEKTLVPLTAKLDGLKSFSEPVSHFVAPGGMSSVVKKCLDESGATVSLNRQVKSIRKEGDKYVIETNDNLVDTCEILISSIPIPQFLALKGACDELSGDVLANLQKVEYTSRFVLMWFYPKGTEFPNLNWASKYLKGDIFCYVTVDNIKRNQENEAPSVVFHTTVQFGELHRTKTKDDLLPILTAAAQGIFPDWPSPTSSKCHKWLYSQVKEGYPGNPGCLLVHSKPTLILAGDAFTSSNLNGCIESARAAVACLSTE